MYLIVGLGNPGPKYRHTRHNIGFLCLDLLANFQKISSYSDKFDSDYFQLDKLQESTANSRLSKSVSIEKTLFIKPQTFMNNSGESVVKWAHFYKIEPSKILVVHDEVDMPFGKMKFQKDRGPGGHNGIKSTTQMLGTQEYARLRLGVGRPNIPGMEVSDYVLQDFNTDEMNRLEGFLKKAVEGIHSFILNGFEKTATEFNK